MIVVVLDDSGSKSQSSIAIGTPAHSERPIYVGKIVPLGSL